MRSNGHQFFVLLATLVLAALLVGFLLWRMRVAGEGGAEAEASKPPPRVSLVATWQGGLAPSPGPFLLMRPLDVVRLGTAVRLDHPLGTENAVLSYNAQPFGENGHLGDDLNGIGGWDSDLGDPVFSVGEGRVVFAGRPSDGWGNMVMVAQRLADGAVIQSVYAHLEKMRVRVDDAVRRGSRIGTVGKGAGQYLAHLHFEMRKSFALSPGAGYFEEPLDRLAPEIFLEAHRGADPGLLTPAPRWDQRDGGEGAGDAPASPLEIRVGPGGAGAGTTVDSPERSAGGGGTEIRKKKTARELRQ